MFKINIYKADQKMCIIQWTQFDCTENTSFLKIPQNTIHNEDLQARLPLTDTKWDWLAILKEKLNERRQQQLSY